MTRLVFSTKDGKANSAFYVEEGADGGLIFAMDALIGTVRVRMADHELEKLASELALHCAKRRGRQLVRKVTSIGVG